jgi:plasmid stabilization system protein ParE
VRILYTNRAKKDIELAFEWYEKQRRGLGFEFIDCIEIALKEIKTFPEMYQVCYFNFRRNVIRRFPFSVFYTIEDKGIIIHSVFDNRKNPGKRP